MGTLLNRRRCMGGKARIKNYFAFEAIEDGTFTLSRYAWEYSLDGRTWTTLEVGTPSPLINAGKTIYWRATLAGGAYGAGRVTSTAKYKVKGNIMSLYYGDNFEGVDYMTGKGSIGREMFTNEQNLISASELELPALALNGACYYQMFYGCSNLIDTPVLPATTLNNQCYVRMFGNCSSLLHPPVLPATTLQTSCYSGMFSECTSLMEAPSLPATTMVNGCYQQMFRRCKALTTAPVLPATTLVSNCYKEMFYGCTNLKYIKAMFTTEPSSSYTQNWVYSVASNGVFIKNPAATWDVRGNSGVPTNWSIAYEIEHLESSGTQYIDTGITPGNTYGYEVKFYINNMSAETAQLGVWHAWGNGMWGHDCKYSANRILCVFGGRNNEYSGKLSQDTHTIKMFNGDFYFDGVLTKQVASSTFTCSGNATMFGIRIVSSSSVEYKNPQKIYSCKIFKDTESNLVRDFIPVRVGTTGYMFDKVSGELFGNAGSGDFTLGSDIIMTSQSNPEVMAICYAQGWCAHDKYMTYSEAAAVTDISTKFYNNQNITHFEELEYFGVTTFSATAFRNCTNLVSVVLGANVTSLGDSMFMSSGLKRLIINSTNITYWGTYSTFRSCPLEYMYSNSQITTPTFSTVNMQSLTTLVLSSNVRSVGGFRCPLLTDVTIPEGVVEITNYGFRECTSLATITLPSTITALHSDTFRHCSALQSVTILATTPPTGVASGLTFANSTCPIYVPSGSVDAYKAASGWSYYASRIQAIPT